MASTDIRFPGNIAQVTTVPDLRNIPSYMVDASSLYVVTAAGRAYSFDYSSLLPDDGIDVIKPTDRTSLQAGRWIYEVDGFAPGPSGPSNNTRLNLAALKAANPTDKTSLFNGTLWFWTTGDYTGLANDITIVKADSAPLTEGAWVQQQSISYTSGSAVALTTPPANYVLAPNISRGLLAGTGDIGQNNHFDGYKSGQNVTGVVYSNIGIGAGTLMNLTGGATGAPAFGTPLPTASGNLCIGDTAGREITTGYENVYLGVATGQQCVAGKWNVAIGPFSQILNQNGECNVSVGAYALVTQGGNNNVAIGWSVMENQATGSNTAVGHNAMGGSITATRNVALGALTLLLCSSGSDNTAIGQEALRNVVSGVNNVALGSNALGAAAGASTNNTALGTNSLVGLTSGDNNVAVGSGSGNAIVNLSNTVSIGTGVNAASSGQIRIGSGANTEFVTPVPLRASADTAIPAGGNSGVGLKATSAASFGVFFGSGAPTLSAGKGSLYLRSDGSTTNDRFYINTDGGTTWTAGTTAA